MTEQAPCYECGELKCGCDKISLATIQDIEPAVLFASGGLEILKAELNVRFEDRPTDASTEDGRKEIISFAMKFAKDGSLVTGIGDEYIEEKSEAIQAENTLINNLKKENKAFKEYCTAKRKEARIPVTKFEKTEKELERLAELAVTLERDEEDAHNENQRLTLLAEKKARDAEDAQKAHDAQVAAEATEQAKADAEKAIADAKAAKEKAEADAKAAEEKELKEAALKKLRDKGREERRTLAIDFMMAHNFETDPNGMRATTHHHFIGSRHYEALDTDLELEDLKQEIIKEIDRVTAVKAQAQRDQDAAVLQVQQEAADIAAAEALEQEERDRQAADVEHQREINNGVLEGIYTTIMHVKSTRPDATEHDLAKEIVTDIAKGEIKHTSIKY